MVKQGDIILIDFNPVIGSEQGGYRPAVVVSNNLLISNTNIISVCPVTSTKSIRTAFNVILDEKTKTQGAVLCAHIKSVDLNKRSYKVVENVSEEIIDEILDTIVSLLERI